MTKTEKSICERLVERFAGRFSVEIESLGMSVDEAVTFDIGNGIVATFSEGDGEDFWICAAYDDDGEFDHSHVSDIPNDCRDEERLSAWIESVLKLVND